MSPIYICIPSAGCSTKPKPTHYPNQEILSDQHVAEDMQFEIQMAAYTWQL